MSSTTEPTQDQRHHAAAAGARVELEIGGMTCASCVNRVERALKKVPGVHDAVVNLATESARVTYAGPEDIEAQIRRAVRNAGYEPRAMEARQAEDLFRDDVPLYL